MSRDRKVEEFYFCNLRIYNSHRVFFINRQKFGNDDDISCPYRFGSIWTFQSEWETRLDISDAQGRGGR